MLLSPSEPVARPGMSLRDARLYLGADGRPVAQTDALLSSHGVRTANASDDCFIPIETCWRVFVEHAAIIGDELHAVASNKVQPGSTDLLIARMLLCTTALDAMHAYGDAARLIAPDVQVTVTRRAESVSIRWRSHKPESEVHRIMLEATAATYFAVFSWLTGTQLRVLRVRAPVARKNVSATPLDVCGAPIAYSGDDLEVVFDLGAANAPVIQRDVRAWYDGVYTLLCATSLACSSPHSRGGFTARVRSALLEGVDQEELAQRCGVSTKTIARRLEQEGRSFRRVRDEVRMEKSVALIHAALSVETIAEQLGYGDTRSFRRAFKRWFGVSPSEFRGQRACAS